MVVANNEINDKNKCRQIAGNFIANQMWQYYAGHIAQWSISRASLEATECSHWAIACAILP
jgi:hypothetical protein